MATTNRYLASVKNVPGIFQKIQDGVPPDRFTVDHLKAIGFGASNDRAIVPLMKDLGFLGSDGQPTQRYRDYRDHARAKSVMAEALREAYSDLFQINERITKADRDAVMGRFKSLHDSSDRVAELQAMTFFALLDLADLNVKAATRGEPSKAEEIHSSTRDQPTDRGGGPMSGQGVALTYRFEIQLPATRDVDVFRAIFRAIREELIDG